MALGAMSRDVMRTVFGSSLRLVAVGVAVGLGGGLVLAKLLAVALIGIKPFDLVAFASTSCPDGVRRGAGHVGACQAGRSRGSDGHVQA